MIPSFSAEENTGGFAGFFQITNEKYLRFKKIYNAMTFLNSIGSNDA